MVSSPEDALLVVFIKKREVRAAGAAVSASGNGGSLSNFEERGRKGS